MEQTNRPTTALFYGVSGAGKGTQAELLTRHLELEAEPQQKAIYIETGEALRGFIRAEGYTNGLTRGVMEKGGLLPSFLPIFVWASVLMEQFTGAEHLILDGLARREPEVPILDAALAFYGRSDYHVFVLDIDDELALERLRSRARSDDQGNEDGMRAKVAWYRENVVPCVALFERMGKSVHHIDGSQTIDEIHADILTALGLAKIS
jgi:adenylate kinase family enzyme